jgi:putative transposase
MRKSRFTEAQIVRFLQEHATGAKLAEVCRRIGVSEAQLLKALEDENRRLKRIVADQALNLQVVKDLLGKKW